jgi:hypothetical protein
MNMRKLTFVPICLVFIFATCKPKKQAPSLPRLEDWKDPSAYFVADSFKYLLPILDTVINRDQRIRPAITSGKSAKKWREESKSRMAEFHKIDQENLAIVTGIIDKYGYLGIKELGFKGSARNQYGDSACRFKNPGKIFT